MGYFGELYYPTKEREFIGLPIEDIKEANKLLDERYNTYKGEQDKLDVMLKNLQVEDRNNIHKQTAINNFRNTFKEVAEQGDYEHAGSVVSKAYKDYLTDPLLQNSLTSFKLKQEFSKSIDDRIGLGEDKNGINKSTADWAKLMSEYNNQTPISIDPNTGIVSNIFKGISPMKDIDWDKKITDNIKILLEHPNDIKNTGLYNAGMGYLAANKTTGVTDPSLRKLVRDYLKTQPEYQDWVKQETEKQLDFSTIKKDNNGKLYKDDLSIEDLISVKDENGNLTYSKNLMAVFGVKEEDLSKLDVSKKSKEYNDLYKSYLKSNIENNFENYGSDFAYQKSDTNYHENWKEHEDYKLTKEKEKDFVFTTGLTVKKKTQLSKITTGTDFNKTYKDLDGSLNSFRQYVDGTNLNDYAKSILKNPFLTIDAINNLLTDGLKNPKFTQSKDGNKIIDTSPVINDLLFKLKNIYSTKEKVESYEKDIKKQAGVLNYKPDTKIINDAENEYYRVFELNLAEGEEGIIADRNETIRRMNYLKNNNPNEYDRLLEKANKVKQKYLSSTDPKWANYEKLLEENSKMLIEDLTLNTLPADNEKEFKFVNDLLGDVVLEGISGTTYTGLKDINGDDILDEKFYSSLDASKKPSLITYMKGDNNTLRIAYRPYEKNSKGESKEKKDIVTQEAPPALYEYLIKRGSFDQKVDAIEGLISEAKNSPNFKYVIPNVYETQDLEVKYFQPISVESKSGFTLQVTFPDISGTTNGITKQYGNVGQAKDDISGFLQFISK